MDLEGSGTQSVEKRRLPLDIPEQSGRAPVDLARGRSGRPIVQSSPHELVQSSLHLDTNVEMGCCRDAANLAQRASYVT